MEWLYTFCCDECGHEFDEFANHTLVKQDRQQVVVSCPKCQATAHVKPIQVATHGGNHSSWRVK